MRFRTPNMKRRAGLSFVELIVAASLMGLIFTIGWTISNSLVGVRKVRNYETAIALAMQALEAVRAARFREIGAERDGRKDTLLADFMSSKNPYDSDKGEGFTPLVKVGNTEFRRDLRIVDCPSKLKGFASRLKLVQVRVTWKAPEDGAPVTFEAATTIADTW